MNKQKASVAQAEREIKALKSENTELKAELERISSLYKQLTEEGPVENYGERRVNLLKSQVIQLERQVLLQSEALASRQTALLEVENNLQKVSDQLREYLASDIKGPTVSVERSRLTTLIENTEAARIRLYKNVERCQSDKLVQPVIYMGDFLKPGRGEDTTLLHVCSGKLEHINLKQVAKLESKLFSLQKQLHSLHESLTTIWSHDNHHRDNLNTQHLTLPINQRLAGQLTKCGKLLQECCQDLLVLSILTPAAPWPVLQRSVNPDINVESVISSLPSFPRSKQQQVKSSVSALLKACNYSRQVAKLEAKACSEELKFHQSVYHLQIKYMESLFNAVREAYSTFESSVQSIICHPLQEILQEFTKLKTSASEEALKDFLKAFKVHGEQLESAVEALSHKPDNECSQGEEALSQFGHEFLTLVHNAALQCAKERDEFAQEIKEVKQMQEQHAKEELVMFKPKEKEPSVSSSLAGEDDSPANNPPIDHKSAESKDSRKSEAIQNDNQEVQSGATRKKEIKTDSSTNSGVQNGVQHKPLIHKKKSLSLKTPTNIRKPTKAKRDVDFKGKPPTPTTATAPQIATPPTPTSRGIPSPTTKSRASSRNIPSPATNRSLSSMGSRGKSPSSRSLSQSGSGIPKISPRTGIPRASSTPSRLSQGGDSSSNKNEN